MKEDKEFDKYIKRLFDEQKHVPSELKWDAMDFDLPKVEKEEKKNKFFFLLLFLIGAISLGLLYNNRSEINNFLSTNVSMENIQSNQKKSIPLEIAIEKAIVNNSELEEKEKIESGASSKLTETMTLEDVSKRLEDVSKRLEDVSGRLNDASKKVKGLNANTLNKRLKNNTTSITETTSISNIKNEDTRPAGSFSLKTINESESIIQKSKVERVLNLPALLINKIENDSTFTVIDTLELNTSFELKSKRDDKIKLSIRDIAIGFGFNNFLLNFKNSESNILTNKVSNHIGNSFRLGTRVSLKGHWSLNLIAKYDQYHTTFEHERFLEPEYDFQRSVKIVTEEVTFHNNYTRALGLQLGIERYWDISIVQMYVNAGISPTYILSAFGKTTFDNEVEPLTMDTNTKKVSLSRNFGIGVLYPINSAFNIGLDFQYSKFFSEGIFINHNVFANQQNALSINLSYKLSQ